MIDRRQALLGTLAAGLAVSVADAATPDPSETIELWPGDAPGMPGVPPVEQMIERSSDAARPDRALLAIRRPRMVVFRPVHANTDRANGSALLVAPGGGYARVVIDKEGFEIGRWLAARGWTVFVLFYRLPGDGWAAGPDVALSDAQRAMRLIRSRARAYGIDPNRVAAMGFSAGGHVCGDLATRYAVPTYTPVDSADRLDARPALAAPIYAVQSMTRPLAHGGSRDLLIGRDALPVLEAAHSPARNVSARTPPCFMVHAEDDPAVDIGNTLQMRAALKAAAIPVETHLFATGGHGFGLRGVAGRPAEAWPTLFQDWARSHGLG